MKIPILRQNGKIYLKIGMDNDNNDNDKQGEDKTVEQFNKLIDEDFKGDYIELFPLKKGYYLIVTSFSNLSEKSENSEKNSEIKTNKKIIKQEKNYIGKTKKFTSGTDKATSEDELAVVTKLLNLRFADRTPSKTMKMLNEREKKVLDSLMRKKQVWLFKNSTKYSKEGVYNIDNKLFNLWKENKTKQHSNSFLFSTLEKNGYVVVMDSNDARRFSDEIKGKKADGKILGVRGFDGKYYISTKKYFDDAKEKILNELKNGDIKLEYIATSCGISIEGCKTILRILSEEGKIIEKKEGTYSST